MTEAQVIALINQWIIANGNNEITADVLRPILLAMVGQPNDVTGDLSDLSTGANTNLVAAINWLNTQISDITGNYITLHQGNDDPNVTPPSTFSQGDFYLERLLDNTPIQLWQYNIDGWKLVVAGAGDQDNQLIPYKITILKESSGSMAQKVAVQINSFPSFTISEKQIPLFYVRELESDSDSTVVSTSVWGLSYLGKGTYGFGGTIISSGYLLNISPPVAPSQSTVPPDAVQITISGSGTPESILNAQNPPIFINAASDTPTIITTNDGVYWWLGSEGTYGVGGDTAVAGDFQLLPDEVEYVTAETLPLDLPVDFFIACTIDSSVLTYLTDEYRYFDLQSIIPIEEQPIYITSQIVRNGNDLFIVANSSFGQVVVITLYNCAIVENIFTVGSVKWGAVSPDLSGTSQPDDNRIHGALFSRGFLFLSTRTDGAISQPQKLFKVNPYDISDYKTFSFPGTGETAGYTTQIKSYKNWIYLFFALGGSATGYLVRIDDNFNTWEVVLSYGGTSGKRVQRQTVFEIYNDEIYIPNIARTTEVFNRIGMAVFSMTGTLLREVSNQPINTNLGINTWAYPHWMTIFNGKIIYTSTKNKFIVRFDCYTLAIEESLPLTQVITHRNTIMRDGYIYLNGEYTTGTWVPIPEVIELIKIKYDDFADFAVEQSPFGINGNGGYGSIEPIIETESLKTKLSDFDVDITASDIGAASEGYVNTQIAAAGIGVTATTGTALPSDNLDLTTHPTGFYGFTAAATGNPATSSGAVIIERAGATGYITQKAQLINSANIIRMFVRHYRPSASVWSSWKEVAWFDEVALKANLSGGNIFAGNQVISDKLTIGVAPTSITGVTIGSSYAVSANNIHAFVYENKSTDSQAEMRFVVRANDNAYFAATVPGSNNAGTFFGVAKSSGVFLFNSLSGGTGTDRDLYLGTFGAKSLFFGTNNVARVQISSAGVISLLGSSTIEVPTATTPNQAVNFAQVPRQLKDFYTDVSNVGTTETDIWVYSMPANTYSAIGQKLIGKFAFKHVDNVTKTIFKMYMGATLVATTIQVDSLGSTTLAGVIEVLFIRTGTTTGRVILSISAGAFSKDEVITDVTGLDFTIVNSVKITATNNTASNNVTGKMGNIVWHPAAP